MHYLRRTIPGAIAAFSILPGCADINQPDDHDAHAGPAMNYHVIDPQLATAGHFVDDGLGRLASEGLQVVIDLRDSPPAGQQQKLAEHGIEWIPVPVDWEQPTLADFDRFKTAMDGHTTDNVLVQCAANYRASAMTYLYQVAVGNVPEQNALQDLHAVWTPNEAWSDYILEVKSQRSE